MTRWLLAILATPKRCESAMRSVEAHAAQIRFWCRTLLLLALVTKSMEVAVHDLPTALGFVLTSQTPEAILVEWGMPIVNAALFMAFAGWLPCTMRTIWLLAVAGVATVAALMMFGSNRYLVYTLYLMAALPLGYFLLGKALLGVWGTRRYKLALPVWIPTFFWLAIGLYSLGIATGTMLKMSALLFPTTHDVYFYRLELAFDDAAIRAARWHTQAPELIRSITKYTYAALGIFFLPLLAWQHREGKANTLHAWRTFLFPFFIAWVCYAWLPGTGPIYLFPMDFPNGVKLPQEMPAGLVAVVSAPRNAMPSMHFSGAVLLCMVAAALRRKWVFALTLPFVLGTAWATLALGEHYVIDLIVALPFATALGLWLIDPPRWQMAARWAHVLHWLASATFVLWMLLLRLAPDWLYAHLGWVRGLSVWSVAAGLMLFFLYVRAVWHEKDTNEVLLKQQTPELIPPTFVAPQLLPTELLGKRWLVGIFFFSGFAGLLYEVVYAKALGVTFGGTALAANTVLMTYMGGMALGAWLGGVIATRTRQPLLAYAYCEAVIGIYAAITPYLFNGMQHVYVTMALDVAPDAPWLTALRVVLGAGVLGLPTVLMGATLPLVFQCLRSMGMPTGRAIAPLYGANVFGAAIGALVAGYALLPAVGRNGATLLAAAVSLLVALYVLDKSRRGQVMANVSNASLTERSADLLDVAASGAPPTTRLGVSSLAVLTIGGIVTLALEVVFMHLLAVVAGNSVYAFGLMLATFLLGLGLGSTAGERLMRHGQRAALVLWAQCGIALAILLTAFVWDSLADYMGSFGYAQRYGLFLGFSARELVRALVCAIAMLPPAFFIGLSYPAAMDLAADWLAAGRFGGQTVRGVGLASALNTVGNIAGVLLTGFWLLPDYGSRNVMLGLALMALFLAALMVWAMQSAPQRKLPLTHWIPVGGAAALLMWFPADWDYTALSRGGNVYFHVKHWGDAIDHTESVEGGLTTVTRFEDESGKQQLTLLTNGKFQGNNAEGGEMVAQESFALIPLMHTAKRGEALVIGYGTGMTTRVLQDQGFAHLDVAELSRDIVTMADKYFGNINAGISHHPQVSMYYTDGRNYLLTQSKQYDLISLEISSIWFAGAANLYNREFYELVNARLRTQGVLQQWVQLHHMRPLDFLYIIGSVRSVFKYVWVYVSGGQGIIVASNDEAAFHNEDAVAKLMHSHTISALKLSELPEKLVVGPQQIDALLQRFDPQLQFLVSTDKNLYLEYATPKGNAIRVDSMPVLINLLQGR